MDAGRIVGPKKNQTIGGWSKLHKKELNNLYFRQILLQYQVKEDEMGRACNAHGNED
jgi:hypothetical protein